MLLSKKSWSSTIIGKIALTVFKMVAILIPTVFKENTCLEGLIVSLKTDHFKQKLRKVHNLNYIYFYTFK